MRKSLFNGLGVLQALIGVGAVAGGLGLALDPSGASLGIPLELLEETPFATYLIPGIVLVAVNGMGSLAGAIASFVRYRYAGEIAMTLGAFLVAWILVQVYWMSGFHWLHWLYLGLGMVEIVLGWSVRRSGRWSAAHSNRQPARNTRRTVETQTFAAGEFRQETPHQQYHWERSDEQSTQDGTGEERSALGWSVRYAGRRPPLDSHYCKCGLRRVGSAYPCGVGDSVSRCQNGPRGRESFLSHGVVLQVPLFLALYRALRKTSLAPALFGSAFSLLGLVALVVSTTPHVAHARLDESIWGMIEAMVYVGFFVIPLGLFVLGAAMFSAPAFGKGYGGLSMVLGATGFVAASYQMVDTASMAGFGSYLAYIVFYLVLGWKLYSLSRGPIENLGHQMVQPPSMKAASP